MVNVESLVRSPWEKGSCLYAHDVLWLSENIVGCDDEVDLLIEKWMGSLLFETRERCCCLFAIEVLRLSACEAIYHCRNLAKMTLGDVRSRRRADLGSIGRCDMGQSRIANTGAAQCVARRVRGVGRSRRCGPRVVAAPCCEFASARAGRALCCPFCKGEEIVSTPGTCPRKKCHRND